MTPTPDARFVFSHPDVHPVAAILRQATGKSVLDFARDALFKPLGIDTTAAIEPLAVPSNIADYRAAKFAWPVDPQHVNLGYSLLTLRPRDMLIGSTSCTRGSPQRVTVASQRN
jgi:CubicO group peptidase (beta-lactamase class C family)